MLKSRKRALEIIDIVESIRPAIVDKNGVACPSLLLECFLPDRFENFVYHLVDNFQCESGIPRDGKAQLKPYPRITLDTSVYVRAIDNRSPSDVFSIIHEAGHLILGHRVSYRGLPGSGSSYLETPNEENEANAFTGFMMVPHAAINTETTADQIRFRYRASREVSERALRQTRAIFPNKWSLK
jgi:hypothetical protein